MQGLNLNLCSWLAASPFQGVPGPCLLQAVKTEESTRPSPLGPHERSGDGGRSSKHGDFRSGAQRQRQRHKRQASSGLNLIEAPLVQPDTSRACKPGIDLQQPESSVPVTWGNSVACRLLQYTPLTTSRLTSARGTIVTAVTQLLSEPLPLVVICILERTRLRCWPRHSNCCMSARTTCKSRCGWQNAHTVTHPR